jgi:MOSC domain-containing protein YiiM
MARLLSVNVGLPREVPWNGKTVRTAVWKFPVQGRLMARKLNIDGDAQGDLRSDGVPIFMEHSRGHPVFVPEPLDCPH